MKALAILFVFSFIGCAVEDQRKSSRSGKSQFADGDAEASKLENESTSGNSGSGDSLETPRTRMGDGRLTELQIASTIPRCGEKFSAKYQAKTELSHAFGAKGDYKFDFTSDLSLSGNAVKATLTFKNLVENLKVTEDVEASKVTAEALSTQGNWLFEFLSKEQTKALKEENETWAKVECALLPVKKVTVPDGDRSYVVEFTPALPSLITPNAHPDVIRADLKTVLEFKNIKAKRLGYILNGEFTAYETPTLISFDFTVSLSEKKDAANKTELQVKTVAKPILIDDRTPEAVAYNLQSNGVFKETTLFLDAELRKAKSFTTVNMSKGNGSYWYDAISYKKVD